MIHPDDRETALAELRTLATTGREGRLEYPMIAADGRLVWMSNTVQPVRLADRGVVQLRGLMIDITERKRFAEERDRLLAAEQAARADAEAVAQRSRFLAEASELLSSSLDRGATLDSLVGLAVPAFADWCLVHLAEPVSGRRLHAAGADADGSRVAEAVERLAPALELPALLPFLERMRAGEPLLVPEIGPAWLEGLQLLRQLSPKSIMVVPLVARGRTVGTLSFIATRSDRRYGPADLALARDLAHRAAIAVEAAATCCAAVKDARQAFMRSRSARLSCRIISVVTSRLQQKELVAARDKAEPHEPCGRRSRAVPTRVGGRRVSEATASVRDSSRADLIGPRVVLLATHPAALLGEIPTTPLKKSMSGAVNVWLPGYC